MSEGRTHYAIVRGLPSPEQFSSLRRLAGLTSAPKKHVTKALEGSWVSFLVIEKGEGVTSEPSEDGLVHIEGNVVGMGRIVGDGALYLQIIDIAIHPDHQKKGLGKKLMKALVEYADKHAPDAYLSLVADQPGGPALYSKFGFSDVGPNSIGMYRCERVRQRRLKKAEEAKQKEEQEQVGAGAEQ